MGRHQADDRYRREAADGLCRVVIDGSCPEPDLAARPRDGEVGGAELPSSAGEGEFVLVTDADRETVGPGTCIGFPAGTGDGHHFLNLTQKDAIFLVIGDRTAGENVVYGHAIHVTEPEIELMGRRRVSVTSHPSCNFHMRNGITPVVPLRAAGVNVAMGLDDKTINDDEDAVMELRMMHKVHRLHTFDLATPALSAYEALEIATLNGARASGFADEVGALVPGMKGDAILVDLDQVARDPWIDPEFDIVDAFVERAMGADVATVVIGGKIVVEDHQPRTIDVETRLGLQLLSYSETIDVAGVTEPAECEFCVTSAIRLPAASVTPCMTGRSDRVCAARPPIRASSGRCGR